MDDAANPDASIRDTLHMFTTDILRSLMALLPLSKPLPTRKHDMVLAIEKQLFGKVLRETWNGLDDMEQLAVREAVYGSGRFDPRRFQAKYGSLPRTFGESSGRNLAPWTLFLYPNHRYSNERNNVPADLAARLKEFVDPPQEPELETVDEPPETILQPRRGYVPKGEKREADAIALIRRDMERSAMHDLPTVLRLIDSGRVTVSATTRNPSAATVKRVAELLDGGDFFDPLEKKERRWDQVPGPVRSFAWTWLVQVAKLARPKGSKLGLTAEGRKALASPAPPTLRDIWEYWLYNDHLDEFSRIDAVKGQFRGKGKRAMTEPGLRREVVGNALAACPVGRWVEFDEFARHMQAAAFDFEVTEDPWTLYLVDTEYGSLGYEGYHAWPIVQGRYVLCVLFEYAATLGMVDIAYVHPKGARLDFTDNWGADELAYLSRYDGLKYFRLNPLGAYCLGQVDEYEPKAPSVTTSITVFADRRIQVHGTLSAEERLLIDTYANAESDDVWRLDADAILTALESGHDIADLHGFLAGRDDQDLPETVEGFLRNIERASSALRLRGSVLLVECADADIASRLADDPKLRKVCRRAGERHLVIETKSERAFRKAAHAHGFGLR